MPSTATDTGLTADRPTAAGADQRTGPGAESVGAGAGPIAGPGTAPSFRPTRITAECRGGRARFTELDQGHYLAPRPVRGAFPAAPNHVRVALIGIHMMLLGGDDVRLQVRVGPGTVLEVVEPAGMVAYDADGVASRWTLDAQLGEGAALIWEGAPFIAADGANVHRSTRISLAAGARALVREALVLGRSGEQGGDLRSITRLTGPDGDLLYEDLDLTGPRRRAVGVLGGTKVLAGATAAGWRPGPLPVGPTSELSGTEVPGGGTARRFDLAADGAVLRALTDSAHRADRQLDAGWKAWKDELLGRSGPA
ncbi:Urease accessory protein UreD [Arthrobacter saudimassiliensis]|uniref:Urease accessory protein UreD n=1 Tax=Arthrobacter saudimassiliensis TaxID=1461584 RepID=A0A078MT72_9MICC|nr:Urease accessory protein UreD [Arthrobacter saudimassiliensis]